MREFGRGCVRWGPWRSMSGTCVGRFPCSATAGFTSIRRPGMPIPDPGVRPCRPDSGSSPPRRVRLYPTDGNGRRHWLDRARRAIADLVGGDPAGGPATPGSFADIGAHRVAAVSRKAVGDIVVSRTDDEENIIPWLRLAKTQRLEHLVGRDRRRDGELPSWQYEKLLTGPVSVGDGVDGVDGDRRADRPSTHRGSRSRARVVRRRRHQRRTVLHTSRHQRTGRRRGGVSAQRWGGPPVAAMVFADPGRINALESVSLGTRRPWPGPPRTRTGQRRPPRRYRCVCRSRLASTRIPAVNQSAPADHRDQRSG